MSGELSFEPNRGYTVVLLFEPEPAGRRAMEPFILGALLRETRGHPAAIGRARAHY